MTDLNTAETLTLDYELPEYPALEPGYRRAPRRESHLTEADKALAIKNALRYYFTRFSTSSLFHFHGFRSFIMSLLSIQKER